MPSVRSMPDAIQVWTIVGLSLLRASLCCIAANAPSRQEQQKTWQEKVWGKPNPRVLDDFELIDGFLLPARPTEGSDLDCCVAAILIHHFGLEPRHACGFISSFRMVDAISARVEEEREGASSSKSVKQEIAAVVEKALAEAGKDNLAAERELGKKRDQFPTPGQKKTLLAGLYLRRSRGNVERAIAEFCKKRSLAVEIEAERGPEAANLKEAVDKRLPVLLVQKQEKPVVVIGYIGVVGRMRFLAHDPATSQPKAASGDTTVSERARTSDVPWIKNYVESLKSVTFYVDHALDSGLALPSGVHFLTPGKEDRAIYIHAFRPDIDGLWTRVRAKLLH